MHPLQGILSKQVITVRKGAVLHGCFLKAAVSRRRYALILLLDVFESRIIPDGFPNHFARVIRGSVIYKDHLIVLIALTSDRVYCSSYRICVVIYRDYY